jgi:hypothetical protein
MAKTKYDGVVEAVRYDATGQVDWVRAYLRRGPTFSDRVLVNRQELVDALKDGKVMKVGKRIEFMASTFEVKDSLRLIQTNGQEIIVSGDKQAQKDNLYGVPLV